MCWYTFHKFERFLYVFVVILHKKYPVLAVYASEHYSPFADIGDSKHYVMFSGPELTSFRSLSA